MESLETYLLLQDVRGNIRGAITLIESGRIADALKVLQTVNAKLAGIKEGDA